MRSAVMGLSFLLALAACTPLESLQRANPQGGDFAESLAAEYMRFAEAQAEEQRPELADYFAAKGLRALGGEEVWPEEPSEWNMDATRQRRLHRAGLRLRPYLNKPVMRVAPRKLARAQLLFDCTVMQAAQAGGDLPCMPEFEASMGELERASLLLPLTREGGE